MIKLITSLKDCYFRHKIGRTDCLYMSIHSVWWTDNVMHLKPKNHHNMEEEFLDPWNGPVVRSTHFEEWLNEDFIIKCDNLGILQNRVRNLMLAHSSNIKIVTNELKYNELEILRNFNSFSKFCDDKFI